MKKNEMLTPSQVIEKYPELEQKFGWTAKDIGLMLKNKLLQGHYNHSLRKSMITEDSLKSLIRFANRQIENQIVTIS
ncbi:MAG: hypothetical protein ACYDCN_08550 [Bacteroidia bacterium]